MWFTSHGKFLPLWSSICKFSCRRLKEQPDVIIHRLECTNSLRTPGPIVRVYPSSGGYALYIRASIHPALYAAECCLHCISRDEVNVCVLLSGGEELGWFAFQPKQRHAGGESKQITFRAFLFLNPCDVILFCQVAALATLMGKCVTYCWHCHVLWHAGATMTTEKPIVPPNVIRLECFTVMELGHNVELLIYV